MKMSKILVAVSAGTAALFLCSCNSKPADWEDAWATMDIVASPAAADQIRIDGEAAPGEWDDAPEYNLARAKDWGYDNLLPRQRKREDTTPLERGFCKVKYDDDFLYVLAVLDDADVVQTCREDQKPAFDAGDAFEIFLKPEDQSAVWELCATPLAKVSTWFYPWAGPCSREGQKFVPGIEIATRTREAADPEKDKAGWIVEMAVPRKLIEQTGGVFAPDKEWRILLVRGNCGKDLPSRQVSSTPVLPREDCRLTEYYAKLKFKKASADKPAAEDKKEPEAVKTAKTEEKK